MSDEQRPLVTEAEKSVLLALALAGCSECSTRLIVGRNGTVTNVRWLRTNSSPAGFRVFCNSCWRKFWKGQLDEKPPKKQD